MTEQPGFFAELKRRNVVRVGVVYLVVAWILAQVADLMLENFEAPGWVIKVILLILIIGFPLAVIFAWAFELTPEGIKKEKDVDRSQSITRQTGRKLDYTIIAVLALALVYFVWESRYSPDSSRPETTVTSQSAVVPEDNGATTANPEVIPAQAAVKEASAKSIAVLPFVNMSDDASNEYFSDGISEEILNALAKVKELKVAGRTSSFAFKGKDQDLRQIGDALGVQNILEGSVRKAGNKVRITAQLIQVEDGFHLWSETYDRQLDDVFAIQDEISTAILEQLKATLIGESAAGIRVERTNSQAYDLYLMAKQRTNDRKENSLQSAIALLDEAITLDPDYAPAYAQRAIATILNADYNYGSIPEKEANAQARLYVDKSLQLNPDLAEGNAALGLYYINVPGQDELAIAPLRKALAANPGMVDASNWLCSALGATGQVEEAFAVFESILARDPFYRPAILGTVTWYNSQGKTDESWALIDRISPFFPDDPMISRLKGSTFDTEGKPAQALPFLISAVEREPSGQNNREELAFALYLTGQYEKVVDMQIPFFNAIVLQLLDRHEEARIIATELASSGKDVSALIQQLVRSGDNAGAVQFFESRWPDFEAFEAEFSPLWSGQFYTYADLAHAYAALGKQEEFRLTMTRFRTVLDRADQLEYAGPFQDLMESLYFTLMGDQKNALARLARAVDSGYLGFPRMSEQWIQLKPLEGDPQFEAIQARMVEHLNAERAQLGLEPMAT